MKIPATAFTSVILVFVTFSAMAMSIFNVNVTDKQKLPEPKVIVLCENLNLQAGWHLNFVKANIKGYRYVSIFVDYYSSDPDDAALWAEPSCASITSGFDGSESIFDRNFILHSGGRYHLASTDFAVGAPYLGFKAYVPSGSIELTIVLYCYN